jgi:ABC-2 type transport system ATP-binding protein
MPVLQEIQECYGYIPEPTVHLVADRLNVYSSQIYGVLTFYAQFHLDPRGKYIVRVCMGTACHVKGSAKVLDHLVFLAEIKGLPARTARQKAGEWLERLGLKDWTNHKVEDLSKGMSQKVQFAGTLLHDPELILLDEPFSGLDPVNSQVMKDVVIDLARQGRTVLFSTHIMEQAEKMCERVVIISRGRKVVDGTMAEVKREGGGRHVALGFHRDAARAAPVLRDTSHVAKLDDSGATAEIELAAGADPDRLLADLVRSGAGISRFEIVEPSLQSIFIAKVGAEAAVAPASEDHNA